MNRGKARLGSLGAVLASGLVVACAAPVSPPAPELGVKNLSWSEIAARPAPPADARIAYGKDPLQFGELRLPEGQGPFPVAIVIHGGCWLAQFDIAHISHLAKALTDLGIATWALEYRRVGHETGGWPNTFLDVAQGADHLRELAKTYPLDLKRVIAMGHSAGGQLSLWLAARAGLPVGSALYRKNPLLLSGVVPLAPITDMAAYASVPNCGEAVKPLMGGTPAQQPSRYAQVSPLSRLPLGLRQRIVHGMDDRIVDIGMVRAYLAAAQNAKDDVTLTAVDGAGHFDLITQDSLGWPAIKAAVTELLRP